MPKSKTCSSGLSRSGPLRSTGRPGMVGDLGGVPKSNREGVESVNVAMDIMQLCMVRCCDKKQQLMMTPGP
jgi:hypothetical protein